SLLRAILNYGGTHTANVPEFTVWSHNSLGDITTQTFHQFFDDRSHELAILRMDQGKVFLKIGGFLGRIKTVHAQKFTRPEAEEPRWVENPGTHVSKPLTFAEIVLTKAQFSR